LLILGEIVLLLRLTRAAACVQLYSPSRIPPASMLTLQELMEEVKVILFLPSTPQLEPYCPWGQLCRNRAFSWVPES
jgi:hypothetical protein